MEIHVDTWISAATLLTVLGLYGRMSVDKFKTDLMWKEYCDKRGVQVDKKKQNRWNRDHPDEEGS